MAGQRIRIPSPLAEPRRHRFAGIGEVFGGAMPVTATTLIGVHSLYQPELLVEIEVVAEV